MSLVYLRSLLRFLLAPETADRMCIRAKNRMYRPAGGWWGWGCGGLKCGFLQRLQACVSGAEAVLCKRDARDSGAEITTGNHSVDTSPSADAWCVSKHFEQQQQLLQGVGGTVGSVTTVVRRAGRETVWGKRGGRCSLILLLSVDTIVTSRLVLSCSL